MIVRRRIFGDQEKSEHEVSSYEELCSIDWIKNIWINAGYRLAYSPRENSFDKFTTLMVVRNNTYLVIGFIHGDGKELGLEDYQSLVDNNLGV